MYISSKTGRLLWLLCAVSMIGCQATLPNVSEMHEETTLTGKPPVIVGPHGKLHPSKSREVLSKLQQKGVSAKLIQSNIWITTRSMRSSSIPISLKQWKACSTMISPRQKRSPETRGPRDPCGIG